MAYGYTGKILRVDLSSKRFTIEEMPENFYRHYFGGEGFVGYFLLKELPPKVDPLSPSNMLIIAVGPLTGAPVGGCGRHSIGGKSPLTGGFGEAEAGGYWGAELKMAGYDAVVVEGKAEKPVYLYIKEEGVEIRDARHLWGMKALECQTAIREELGDSLVKVALIGPAGENLARFACVMNDLDAAAGRTGMGAVMGSKNLKAVACRGGKKVSVAHPEGVGEVAEWVKENCPKNLEGMREFGTARAVLPLHNSGGLPTRNFQSATFEGAEKISGQAMTASILVKRRGCFACPVRCKREVRVDGPIKVDPRYGGPEYETIAALGSDCGVDDLSLIAKGNELVNAYGLDSMSCGATIAFAMECFEKGLLSKADTGGLDLHFGNGMAMLQMVERIALREGLGDVLAEGVARASQQIKGSEDFALHIKGQELPMHEPRWKPGLGLGYSMSPTGADHVHNMHDSTFTDDGPMLQELKALGILEPLVLSDMSPAKIRPLIYASSWVHFLNCAVCCYFVMNLGLTGFDRVAELVRAVTGWNTSVFELMKVGERASTLARVFNAREGFTSSDDSMPKRFFTPQTSGPLKGVALDFDTFQKAKETYYEMMGWPDGVPSLGKLGELGIEWAALVR